MHSKSNQKYNNQITNSFRDIFEFLKKYQRELWKSIKKGNAAFYILNIEKTNASYSPLNIINLKRQVESARYFVPELLYKQFICEYEKTIVLMDKILIKAITENKMEIQKEEQDIVNNVMEKLAFAKEEIENIEKIFLYLQAEGKKKGITRVIGENRSDAEARHQ